MDLWLERDVEFWQFRWIMWDAGQLVWRFDPARNSTNRSKSLTMAVSFLLRRWKDLKIFALFHWNKLPEHYISSIVYNSFILLITVEPFVASCIFINQYTEPYLSQIKCSAIVFESNHINTMLDRWNCEMDFEYSTVVCPMYESR